MMSGAAIAVTGLRKSYGDIEAVRGVDLTVEPGQIFALLGPNGAGKTTVVEVLEGYRSADAGHVSVLGVDPARPTRGWREQIGIVLQACTVQPHLTIREALTMFSGYYAQPRPVSEVLDLVGLTDVADQRAGRMSGGQQRRLDVGLALVGDPDLLFLDEPTTGFDPAARRQAWEMIAGLRDLGKTVLLTTHYMEEADALADRVAVMVDGLIVAAGHPGEIGGAARNQTAISFELSAPDDATSLTRGFERLPAVVSVDWSNNRCRLISSAPTQTLAALTASAIGERVELIDLHVARPTLEQIYLDLTARAVEPNRS